MSVLSEELKEKIKAYLPRYPHKQAVTLPALHLVHDELRCVPREAIREIADLLDLSPAEVHDTVPGPEPAASLAVVRRVGGDDASPGPAGGSRHAPEPRLHHHADHRERR